MKQWLSVQLRPIYHGIPGTAVRDSLRVLKTVPDLSSKNQYKQRNCEPTARIRGHPNRHRKSNPDTQCGKSHGGRESDAHSTPPALSDREQAHDFTRVSALISAWIPSYATSEYSPAKYSYILPRSVPKVPRSISDSWLTCRPFESCSARVSMASAPSFFWPTW